MGRIGNTTQSSALLACECLNICIGLTDWLFSDTSYKPRYPLIGRNGLDLREKWAEYPNAYLSMCVEGYPNLFMISGRKPNRILNLLCLIGF